MRHLIIVIAMGICCLAISLGAQTTAETDPLDQNALKAVGSAARDLETAANQYYQTKDYLNAAKAYLRIVNSDPANSNALYNLACCYGLLGQAQLASEALGMAFKAGFEDLNHIDNDADFSLVRETPEYKGIRDSLDVWTARMAEREGKLEYYPVRSYLPYRVYLPPHYDPSRQYKLLIALHGFGDNAVNFGYIYDSIKDLDLIMVVPEAPFLLPNKGFQGFSWSPMVERDHYIWEQSFVWLEDALMDLNWSLKEKYKPQSTWLIGFSQGCAYTLVLGLRRPELYDGLIAFGGWLETDVLDEDTLKKAVGLPVFIAHGDQDRIVSFKMGSQAYAKLKALGYDVSFHSFEGGHKIDHDALMDGIAWLSGKSPDK